jgi:hypothetical protein
MTRVEELRVGNLLNWKGKGTCKVINVSQTRFKVVTPKAKHPDQDEYEHVKSIPLTPEWLGKFGFEDIGPYWQYIGEPGFVLLKEDGMVYIGNPVRTYVKTVHHLQNLYFALTEGVELNVKL